MARLTEAKINFISLVKKGANKKTFAIVKSDDGNIESFHNIIKQNDDKMQVTCVVYEPNVKDAHGDYMTAEDIEKSAHDFLVNGKGVDIQHDEKLADVKVVESWVTKSDTTIGGQDVSKGTWMATMQVNDTDIWKAIKDGELGGFSMGGIAKKINKSEDNMEDLAKKIVEEIQKSNNLGETKELKKQLEDLKEQIGKSKNEEVEKLEKQLEEVKEAISKTEEIMKSNNSIITGDNEAVTISKAVDDYDKILKDATLVTGVSLIPIPLSNQMVKDMKEISSLFNYSRKLTGKGTMIRVPVRLPNEVSSAKKKAEKQVTDKGTINIKEVQITKGVYQSVIDITDEARRDSQFNIVQLVREYSTEDLAELIEIDTYKGTGDIKGFFTDTEFKTRIMTTATPAVITWDELVKLESQLKAQYKRNAKYYVSKNGLIALKTMKDENGRPLWQQSLIPGAPSTFNGYPVMECVSLDADCEVLFADFEKLYSHFVDYQMESEYERSAIAGYNSEIVRARLGGTVCNQFAGYMLKFAV